MTTTNKAYVKTFTNKWQALAYYNKIECKGNLVGKGMGRLAGTDAYEVRTMYTVTKQLTRCVKKCTKGVDKITNRCYNNSVKRQRGKQHDDYQRILRYNTK